MSTFSIRPTTAQLTFPSLFLTDAWLDIFGGDAARYGVFDKGEEPIAVFAVYHGLKMGRRFLITPPLTPHCALSIHQRSQKPSSTQTLLKKVQMAMIDFFAADGADVIDIQLPTSMVDTQEFLWAHYEVQPRYTYQLDLRSDDEALWQQLSTSKRQNINKAIKDELLVRMSSDTMEISALMQKTFDSTGGTYHRQELEAILDSDALADNRYAIITEVDGRTSSVVLVVHDKHNAYYLLGGYDRDNGHDGSGSLGMWRAIEEAKRRECLTFDFLGSMIPEVERYTRGFGGVLTPFYNLRKRSKMAEVFMKLTGRGE